MLVCTSCFVVYCFLCCCLLLPVLLFVFLHCIHKNMFTCVCQFSYILRFSLHPLFFAFCFSLPPSLLLSLLPSSLSPSLSSSLPPSLLSLSLSPFIPDYSLDEMERLLVLLLGCVVQCDGKVPLIERMKAMDLTQQQALVSHIQQMTDTTEYVCSIDWNDLEEISKP